MYAREDDFVKLTPTLLFIVIFPIFNAFQVWVKITKKKFLVLLLFKFLFLHVLIIYMITIQLKSLFLTVIVSEHCYFIEYYTSI